MSRSVFSYRRWIGILVKEFIQVKRDRLTFGMIVGIPVLQLLLFGFAINTDPKNLPTVVYAADSSIFSRSFVAALENTGYFKVTSLAPNEAEAQRMIAEGVAQFVVTIPADFSRKLARGERPEVLVEADATDPTAVSNAVSAVQRIAATALTRDLQGVLGRSIPAPPPVDIRVQRRYNPEGVVAYNIVPGLLGTILTMTMILMTGLAITRERERGTFENLLSTPALPIEVMTGKIVPYILIGLIQVALILLAARFVFGVPMQGSLLLLLGVVLIFIAANLTLGIMFSSIARNQLQAMQMTFFFFLPSILLSGFMFPFRGMPEWAQWIGNVLPLTHFLLLVRGILLKGNGLDVLWPQIWPIVAFMLAVILIGLRFYRRTLD
ncbi:MAG: ABC transporter permease [Betaproteobacteria bacterium]|jgi:ABC-2 type transport system permease protein|nr:ABC transporter permease [Betaproteobacteria bacterium]